MINGNAGARTDGVKHRMHTAEGRGGVCSCKGDSGYKQRQILTIGTVAGYIDSILAQRSLQILILMHQIF